MPPSSQVSSFTFSNPDNNTCQASAINLLPESDVFNESMLTSGGVKCQNTSRHLHNIKSQLSTSGYDPELSERGNASPQLPVHSSKQPSKNNCIKNATTLHADYSEHLTIPTITKKFTCKKCSEWFKSESRLNIHVKNNCDPYPYKCDQCSEKFSDECFLTNHQMVHSKEKPYKCDQCFYCSRWKQDLKIHDRRYHGK